MAYQITGDRLTSLFRPRSVALVGASDKSAFSLLAYRNLVEFGFAEHTYLVNRRGTRTHGQPTVTSCAQIGEPVDVAYLMVPQAGLLEALDDAAAAGIRNACVLSSGYAEAGEAGRAAQAELAATRPDSAWCCSARTTSASPTSPTACRSARSPGCPPKAARWRCCRRAGPAPRPWWTSPRMVNVGLSYLVTLGNEAMITAGHVLDFLVDDPGTRAVAVFMETVRDPETFRRAARRAAAGGQGHRGAQGGQQRAVRPHRGRAHRRARRRRPGHRRGLRRPGRDPGRLDRGHADHRRGRRRARPAGPAGHRHRVDLRRRLRHRRRPGR